MRSDAAKIHGVTMDRVAEIMAGVVADGGTIEDAIALLDNQLEAGVFSWARSKRIGGFQVNSAYVDGGLSAVRVVARELHPM